MTVPPAALPGHNFPAALVEFHDTQHEPAGLVCPACGQGDRLVASYAVLAQVDVTVRAVPNVSQPEVLAGEQTSQPPADLNRPQKIQCGNCRWAYTGPDPLARLQEVHP